MDSEPPSLLLFWATMGFTQIISLIFLFVLLLCSALISGAEVAFFSLTPANFITEDGKRTKTQNIVINLLEKPKKLLATILVANNFINIAIVLLFDNLADPYQMTNLVDDPDHAATLQLFREQLRERLAAINDTFEQCTWYRDHWTEDRIILRTATSVMPTSAKK